MTLSTIIYSAVSIFFASLIILVLSIYIISRAKKAKRDYSSFSSVSRIDK